MKFQLMQIRNIDLQNFLNLNFMDTSDISKSNLVALNKVRQQMKWKNTDFFWH